MNERQLIGGMGACLKMSKKAQRKALKNLEKIEVLARQRRREGDGWNWIISELPLTLERKDSIFAHREQIKGKASINSWICADPLRLHSLHDPLLELCGHQRMEFRIDEVGPDLVRAVMVEDEGAVIWLTREGSKWTWDGQVTVFTDSAAELIWSMRIGAGDSPSGREWHRRHFVIPVSEDPSWWQTTSAN